PNGGVILSYGSGGYGFGLLDDGHPFLTKVDVDDVIADFQITDTNFHHLAVTKAGSSVVFFVDGVAHPAPAYNTTYQFTLNAAVGARGDTFRNSFFGLIDEVSIYDRALTSSELQSVFNAGAAGKCPPSVQLSCVTPPSGLV